MLKSKELVQAKRPARAVVSKILFEDYTENVMSINDYMLFCTNVQLNKALGLSKYYPSQDMAQAGSLGAY
ncbi:MAG: hypothetical protein WB392_04805 [Methanotrichaceae archaeon]